ncbi:MAG: Fur family transcriptional regulator [bacterium]|nr:Fur family transcriptional regulator [bacterium]MDZ4286260.1 Fur family transcriptional regulator [Candidatus Sungbacteria bacterium]
MKQPRKAHQQQFRMTLRKAGYKATPTRLAVISLLKESKKPLSPQAVIELMRKDIDQATVYRILKTLKKIGVIRQVDFRHNHPHYEIADQKDHHHLICLSCGLSEEIIGCDVDSMKQSVLRQAKRFSHIQEHALEFYGTCKECAGHVGLPHARPLLEHR